MTVAADLHIHTALSPCAAEEMTPPAIVQAARARGLAMIAICDHNTAGNAAAVQAAAGDGLAVLAGLEVTTAEEVHVLGLFPSAKKAVGAADEVRQTLPVADEGYYGRFGPQYVMENDGTIVGREPKMLAMASALPLATAVEVIHRHAGVAIAAHIDRPSFSVFSQLGVFPMDAGFDGVEVFAAAEGKSRNVEKSKSRNETSKRPNAQTSKQEVFGRFDALTLGRFPIVRSSDSHFLADIGRVRTVFRMQAASFQEMVLALRGEDGRGVEHA